ncbi:aspartate/glutamate racemase family protein [Steroidobacter sp.]|uniref:aspartate/glutamate racemase family protein n=1 Tax=Steroidobacter sp. TaxID=1978227 RepID=UPI001A43F1FB|nr:aspartate/glutamate racemase family protein [Steroidobacter sp.]MBL8264832.1 aspartate/glutamate racemase family protein [Steroidobacter sp.]
MSAPMQRIGLIGGISWAATADYYRYINLDVRQRLGGHHSADMVIRSLDLHPLLQQANDIDAVEQVMRAASDDLQAASASLIAIASFTGHRYAGALKNGALPFVDLTEAIGAAVREAGYERIGVWATSYALQDSTLMSQLSSASGAQLISPPRELHAELDRIVFSEIAAGALTTAATQTLQRLLLQQVEQGAQALLLATTDFSPLLGVLESPVPMLDGSLIHCRAIVDAALA